MNECVILSRDSLGTCSFHELGVLASMIQLSYLCPQSGFTPEEIAGKSESIELVHKSMMLLCINGYIEQKIDDTYIVKPEYISIILSSRF